MLTCEMLATGYHDVPPRLTRIFPPILFLVHAESCTVCILAQVKRSRPSFYACGCRCCTCLSACALSRLGSQASLVTDSVLQLAPRLERFIPSHLHLGPVKQACMWYLPARPLHHVLYSPELRSGVLFPQRSDACVPGSLHWAYLVPS